MKFGQIVAEILKHTCAEFGLDLARTNFKNSSNS